jgi:hypothetical protein
MIRTCALTQEGGHTSIHVTSRAHCRFQEPEMRFFFKIFKLKLFMNIETCPSEIRFILTPLPFMHFSTFQSAIVTKHGVCAKQPSIKARRRSKWRRPKNNTVTVITNVGRDRSVGTATCYGLDGPGLQSRWGARFSSPVQTGPAVHPASYTKCTASFPGIKRLGRVTTTLSSAEVKERVKIYLYSSSGTSWPVQG